jgi:formate-dependent nitrite reductase membrane component NrfD
MASDTNTMSREATRLAHDHDGRNIDTEVALLEGEAARVDVKAPREAFPVEAITTRELAVTPSPGEDPTYYDQPMLAEPVWKWAIPTYFFVGGLAGATSAIGAAAELIDAKRLGSLVRAARWIGAAGDATSAALLVYDLGRPSRFLNMLRVFRPTSPMSVGTYILSASGAANTTAILFGPRDGFLGRAGTVASITGGVLGLPLAGYTAVLLTNTAVPAWQGASRTLPYLFVASAMASSGALLSMLPLGRRADAIARRYALAGQAGELIASFAVARELGRVPVVGRALHHGVAGALWTTAKVLGASALALSLPRSRSRAMRFAAGALGLGAALATRFAIFQAGKASARDPRASFHAQRAGLGSDGDFAARTAISPLVDSTLDAPSAATG